MKNLLKISALSALALASCASVPVMAQDASCAPSQDVYGTLEGAYGEQRHGYGMVSDHLAELWVNEETGSFTILLTRPDGMSCIGIGGTNWESFAPVVGEPS